MTRLHSELHRLYLPGLEEIPGSFGLPSSLVDADNHVRAMVMTLNLPAGWELLSKVWHGVQSELGLPAPAIAVSGTEGLQLWFSVTELIPVQRAHEFLESLRLYFMADVDSRRIDLLPAWEAASGQPIHARPVPALQENGNWSAFVAPDLAALFADTPWLDIPPGEEGQAALLHGMAAMKMTEFDAAIERLSTIAQRPARSAAAGALATTGLAATTDLSAASCAADEPRAFLLRVMNDETVALALRVEAAKALLLHSNIG